MDPKTVPGKKAHLGGMLRIFAKSVQDVTGKHLKKPKSPTLELDANSGNRACLGKSPSDVEKDHKKSPEIDSRIEDASQKRKVSSVPLSEDSKSENHRKISPSTVSQIDLNVYSTKQKETLQPDVSFEDWSSDLMVVESPCKVPTADFIKYETSSPEPFENVIKTTSETEIKGNSEIPLEKKDEECCFVKKSEKVRVKSEPLETSRKIKKKSPKSSTPEHEEKMRSKKRTKKRLPKRLDMIAEVTRRKSSEKESNASRSCHKNSVSVQIGRRESKTAVPTTNEDWSSDLLDTSSCSSRTSKDELCEVFVTSSEVSKKHEPDKHNVTQLREVINSKNRNSSEEDIEVFETENESDLLDKTLTKPMGEDWSSDLLNVPSSRNPSPVLTESRKTDETNSYHRDKDNDCLGSERSELPSVDYVTEGKVEEICHENLREQRYGGFKPLFSTKSFEKPQERFVDDVSDLTSDQETMSELESQAPSTVESIQDETICSSDIHENILDQEEDLDYISSNNQCKPNRIDGWDGHGQRCRSDQSIHHREAPDKTEGIVSRNNQEGRSCQEIYTSQVTSTTRYPFLHIPVASIRSRESAEQLLDFIDSRLQQLGLANQRESQRSIVFSVADEQGQGELQIGIEQPDSAAASYPQSAYSWNWACHPWAPYLDPTAYPMCDPRMIQNPYYPYYGDPQKDFPYYFNSSCEGNAQRKMPLDDKKVKQETASIGDPRIVDYDSSSEDERLALLAHRKQQSIIMENQRHDAGNSYASILTNHCSKRSLQETYGMNTQSNKDKVQRTATGKLQRLGPPKQARHLPGGCTDWNKDLVSDGSDVYEASDSEKNQDLVKHARSICSQYNTDSSVSQRRAERPQTSDSEKRRVDPKVWSMRRNRNVIDSDLDESFEVENMNDEKEVRSPGCYPYLTIGKMKSQHKEDSENDLIIPPLFSAAQWSSWATDKDSILAHKKEKEPKRESYNQVQEPAYTSFSTPKRAKPESLERGNVHSPHISSPLTSPQVMPVCPQPFWADPRMGYPFPSYYPPHWMPGIPSAYYRSPPPPPPPPQPSSSPSSTQATTSSPQAYSYVVAQYASARSRTTSAPPIEVEKILQPESTSEEKSCKNYFLGEKNRRVSDSVLRSNAEFAPKRSSYASRLQNDARLNANFPQLDWKIRFKSRCKTYGHKYVDSHCHLDFLFNREGFKGSFAKYMLKHEDTFPENFEGCVAVFCNPATFLPYGGLWKELAKERNVWLTMGCHPKNVTDFDTAAVEGLKRCIQHPRIIAVGEIGLDYSGTFRQHENLQKKMFASQLQLALDVKKPLVIHCRQAEEDCLEIMEKIVPRNYKIHCHCFTGTYEQCKKWLTKFPNLYIGLTNLVSFRSATPTHEVARHIPLPRLLLETDSPYFVPRQVPKGEFDLSHPGMAVFVAEEVARIKGVPVGIVLKQCRSNTLDMYGV